MSRSTAAYVGKGLVRVVQAPAALRSVVGPGYVVCIRNTGGNSAGMAHVASGALHSTDEAMRRFELVDALLDEFRASGEKVRGARADIVGGADVLRLHPQHTRQRLVDDDVARIRSMLEEHGARVERLRVGGVEARRVELEVPAMVLDVQPVGRARRKPLPTVRTDDIDSASNRAPGRCSEVVVNMGCIEVAKPPSCLVALLGSCVGVALFDPEKGLGGLAHVMMPASREADAGTGGKFADLAVPKLVSSMLRAGANKKRLVAKLVGGADVLSTTRTSSGVIRIGEANIAPAERALDEMGIDILWQDTGGRHARRMSVELKDFDIHVRKINGNSNGAGQGAPHA